MKRIFFFALVVAACLSACKSNKPRELVFELLPADFMPMYNELGDTVFVIESQADFDSLSTRMQLQFHQQEMDLSPYYQTHTLLLVYGGWQRSTGYKLESGSMVQTGKKVQIKATLYTPGEGCLQADMITYPMQLLAVPKQKKVRYSLYLQKVTKNCW